MRKKAKSGAMPKSLKTSASQQKAALRSDAFRRAVQRAQSLTGDRQRLRRLVEEAGRKAASVPREPFAENWPYLQTMLRFIRAYYRQEYTGVSEDALLPVIAALNYLIDPFDLIPDEIPFLGFVDDASVVEFAVLKARQTLDDFMIWESTSPPRGN